MQAQVSGTHMYTNDKIMVKFHLRSKVFVLVWNVYPTSRIYVSALGNLIIHTLSFHNRNVLHLNSSAIYIAHELI